MILYNKNHLKDINESYVGHMFFALKMAFGSIFTGISLIVHAIFPFIIVDIGSTIIIKLFNILQQKINLIHFNKQNKNRIAIIGFGASGLIVVCNIINKNTKKNLEIDIFDDSHSNGLGIAYSSVNFNHLLNVKAKNMSIFQDNPMHFVNWLAKNGYQYKENDFVPRVIYGIYLKNMLDNVVQSSQTCKVNIINSHVTNVEQDKYENFIIDHKYYSKCVVATGVCNDKIKYNLSHFYLEKFLQKDKISIKGAGLTAFDTCISLADAGFRGMITLYSRNGKMSCLHEEFTKIDKPIITLQKAKNMPLYQIFHFFKAEAKNKNILAIIDSIRSITQELWQQLSDFHKKQFMRHLYPIFNRYRHRAPGETFNKIAKMMEENKLFLEKSQKNQQFDIDCSGICPKKPDFLQKITNKNLYTIGPVNFEELFETIAIPEIRKTAENIANQI